MPYENRNLSNIGSGDGIVCLQKTISWTDIDLSVISMA